jgi:hypothetical protein
MDVAERVDDDLATDFFDAFFPRFVGMESGSSSSSNLRWMWYPAAARHAFKSDKTETENARNDAVGRKVLQQTLMTSGYLERITAYIYASKIIPVNFCAGGTMRIGVKTAPVPHDSSHGAENRDKVRTHAVPLTTNKKW